MPSANLWPSLLVFFTAGSICSSGALALYKASCGNEKQRETVGLCLIAMGHHMGFDPKNSEGAGFLGETQATWSCG